MFGRTRLQRHRYSVSGVCVLTWFCINFVNCGFLISKWQGTASSWQGLGPAWPALGYATVIVHRWIWDTHACLNYAAVSALSLDHDFHEEENLGKIAVNLITIFF